MRKKRVFIGCSTQAIDIAFNIKSALEKLGADVTFWDDQHAFTLGDHLTDDLIQAAHQHDAGVFILSKDDKFLDPCDNIVKYLPRDNVLIEAGMFMGVLGKKSVALCTVPEVRKASDFAGIETIEYNNRNPDRVSRALEKWLNDNIKARHVMAEENNVLMLPRSELHNRYSIDDRLHLSDELYKQINHIRIMNLTCNLIINPELGEIGHIPPSDMSLSGSILKIMSETNAHIDLMLAEPNEYNISDLKTKIANLRAGSTEGSLYSALATLYNNLTSNTIYAQKSLATPILFQFYAMKTSMPFGIFNVEFLGTASKFNHVKVDLYSAALDNENNRRSFVIWKDDDPENYQFFVNNFNNIKNNPSLCEKVTLETLQEWAKEWEHLRPRGNE